MSAHKNFNTSHVSINLTNTNIKEFGQINFNTSHVSINRSSVLLITPVRKHFNTSHVSINLICRLCTCLSYSISIHLMFLLISFVGRLSSSVTLISIHLMFLLIYSRRQSKQLLTSISIHLMFLLIGRRGGLCRPQNISIHLMFLLIKIRKCCVCATLLYFNTSHVSINQWSDFYLALGGIHFNTSHVSINRKSEAAQTVLQTISIHLMFLLIIISPISRISCM